ncbi:MAG: hypothetical protein ACFE0J_20365 [Elainellaceae cyanobacterium]
MAKRRNLKKEKALRNQAYARKFRKRTSGGRFNRRRSPNMGNNSSGDDEQDSNEDGGNNETQQNMSRRN